MNRRLASILMLVTLTLTSAPDASAWGQKGHDVICAIAQRHLTKKAEAKVSEILDGKSLVYWANWLDNASHTQEYSYTRNWHFKDTDADEDFNDVWTDNRGNVLPAVNAQIIALKNKELGKEESALALKILIHLMGDMHCPMHLGHYSDKGGNKWQVQYFGKGSNLHKIWDSDMVEMSHKWTHTEWADEIDRADKDEQSEIISGNTADWCRETWQLATKIYDETPVGSKLFFDYLYKWSPVIENQFLKSGLRLAHLLNEIYK